MWIKVMPVKTPDLYSNIPNVQNFPELTTGHWIRGSDQKSKLSKLYALSIYRSLFDPNTSIVLEVVNWKVPCKKTVLFKNLQYNKFSSFHFHLAVNLYEMIIKWNEHKPRKIIPSQQYVFEKKSISLKYYTLLLSRNL